MTCHHPRVIERLRDPRTRLVLTSGTLLFVELLLIRWIPSEVRYIGFFSNFVLMASFLGIGLGILLGRRRQFESIAVFPILLAAFVWLITSIQLNVQVRSSNEVFFGLAESNAADANFLVLPLVFVLVTALMASLALPLGPLLRSMPPLKAYAFDIAGSMLGIVGFVAVSTSGTAPAVWFTILAVLIVLLAAGGNLVALLPDRYLLRPERPPLRERERDPPPGLAPGHEREGAVLRPALPQQLRPAPHPRGTGLGLLRGLIATRGSGARRNDFLSRHRSREANATQDGEGVTWSRATCSSKRRI